MMQQALWIPVPASASVSLAHAGERRPILSASKRRPTGRSVRARDHGGTAEARKRATSATPNLRTPHFVPNRHTLAREAEPADAHARVLVDRRRPGLLSRLRG